jgi:polysaccharide export outer membrane protein
MKNNHPVRVPTQIITALLIIFGFVSCTTAKKLSYFKDLPDSVVTHLPLVPQQERVVELGDRIEVSIGGRDQEAANFFNKSITATPGTESGYIVDYDGMIEFPIIGKFKAKGLTARQMKDNLTRQVTPYLKEPLVDVRFVTFRITVLGEVRSPGAFVLNSQRTTIFDALAAAGDLPRSAKRQDIRIFRDYNGERTVTKIDLRKKDVLYNPDIFQMRHNDVIYVQPRNSSVFTEDFGLFTSIFGVAIGVFTLIFTVLNNN